MFSGCGALLFAHDDPDILVRTVNLADDGVQLKPEALSLLLSQAESLGLFVS